MMLLTKNTTIYGAKLYTMKYQYYEESYVVDKEQRIWRKTELNENMWIRP